VRILFVYPKMTLNLALGNMPPIAVLSLASFIQREGHRVRIYERNIDGQSLSRAVEGFKPDAAVLTLMFAQQIADMQAVCEELRASFPALPILCGGLTASLIPDLILRDSGQQVKIGVLNREWEFPAKDIKFLPAKNASTESIAAIILAEFVAVMQKNNILPQPFSDDQFVLTLEEDNGMYARVGASH